MLAMVWSWRIPNEVERPAGADEGGHDPETEFPMVPAGRLLVVAVTVLGCLPFAAQGVDLERGRLAPSPPDCTVAAPVFDPPGGTFWVGPAITVTTATEDATVWVRTGEEPWRVLADLPDLPPAATTTLQAWAYKHGCARSPLSTATFVITGQVPAPSLNPPAGTYPGPVTVTVAPPAGAAVSITTDGTDPAPGVGWTSEVPVTLELTTHTSIRALAYREHWQDSPTVSGEYAVTYSVGGSVRRLAAPVTLSLNGAATLVVAADGPFRFSHPLLDGAPYQVEVAGQGDDQECAVLGGTGLIHQEDVGEVEVVCRLASDLEHQLFLFMDAADVDELYGRDPMSEDPLPGYVRFALDGPVVNLHSLRFRGSSSRFLPKKSFNIRFSSRQDVLFGSNRMNLNAMYTDPSMMRETLSMELFRLRGRPAPRTRYFDFYLNEIFEGLHVHIERIDGDLVAAWGLNPNGTLVRDEFRDHQDHPLIQPYGLWSAFGFNIHQVPPESQASFLAGTFDSRGDPQWGKLAELLAWAHDTPPGPQFAAGFAERFHEDTFLDWLAISILIGEIDGFWDDYWLYLDHDDPAARWVVIPWDKDLTFGAFTRPDWGTANHYFSYETSPWASGGRSNALVWKLFDTPALSQRVAERVLDLMDELFHLEYFTQRTEELGRHIARSAGRAPLPGIAFHRHPANHHGNPAHWDLARETLLEFVDLRRRYLNAALWPAAGTPYHAEVSLAGIAAGDTVHFTDAAGWTMARFVLAEDPEPTTTMAMEVFPQAGIAGVDRVWRITSTGGPLGGHITLYYRNDVLEWAGRENWCTDSDHPIGRQWELEVGHFRDGLVEPVPSRPNPYANAVTAPVILGFPGAVELVLTFSGHSK